VDLVTIGAVGRHVVPPLKVTKKSVSSDAPALPKTGRKP
jgi:hypothetical protein